MEMQSINNTQANDYPNQPKIKDLSSRLLVALVGVLVDPAQHLLVPH